MLPTPDYSHLKMSDFEKVYEPAEDTFVFLDALENDLELILSMKPSVCIEIGCGSGVVINFLTKHLTNQWLKSDKLKDIGIPLFIATDINKDACEATIKTTQLNSNNIQVVNCDLLSPLIHRLENRIDILLFNPPYVVTDNIELGSSNIQAAWAGGIDGRQVMNRLFKQINNILSPNGIFYLICIKQNDIISIEKDLAIYGFEMKIIITRKAGIETLYCLRFMRKTIKKDLN
jgi:release factor glutamine methyltransferase